MRDGLTIAVAGTALGAAAAWATTRLVSRLLFGIGAFDLVTVAAVATVLVGVSALASYLPARRVDRIDAVRAMNATG